MNSSGRTATSALRTRCSSRTYSTKALQGEAGCKGRSIPMEKLDNLVAEHIAARLLQPERIEEVLAPVLDRRQEAPSAVETISPN